MKNYIELIAEIRLISRVLAAYRWVRRFICQTMGVAWLDLR
jgi:hypothetical protein